MDLNAPKSSAVSSQTMLDTAIRIALVAGLVYASGRIVLPFTGVLAWSAILAVMLYPLHLRLAAWLGNRWSAVLIGLLGVAVALGPMVIAVTSLATSIYSLTSTLQSRDLTLPLPPLWLEGTPLVGSKLTEAWTLVATNLPAALAKYGQLLSRPATWLASFAGGLATGELAFVLSFVVAAVLVGYGTGAAEFARQLLERATGSATRAMQLATLTAARSAAWR
jgi:predicted PurR-regulated permease PerM